MLDAKLDKLTSRLQELRKVVLGFSGGIDSTLLLKLSVETLGAKNVWAVTGDSESLLPEELESCRNLIRLIGLDSHNFIEIKTNELNDPNYIKNPPDRCFYCKSELFSQLQQIARNVGAEYILDGANADDLNDYRPGRGAAINLGVISPLAEAGITKNEIRELALRYGLPNWDKPSLACLSSRIPYGSEVTREKLAQIAEAERFLHAEGFTQLRVRHHDKIARIELEKDQIPIFFKNGLSERVIARFKELGFIYVTLDLQGYRTGSMNENLKKDK